MGAAMNTGASHLDHPQRSELSNEVHARPSDPLPTPCSLSYMARLADRANPAREGELLESLLRHYDLPLPEAGAKHYSVDAGPFRLRWERHTEFSRYAITEANPSNKPYAEPPIRLVPQDWLQQLEGSVLVAVHTQILTAQDNGFDHRETSLKYFDGNTLVGAQIAGGSGLALTDFRLREDGFNRLLVLNEAMTETQTGRMVQRLLEIDTYRMMTLLALPVAQSLGPRLGEMEQQFAAISTELTEGIRDNDQGLLDRIMRLEAESEASRMQSQFRFSAAEAYYELVLQRVAELREVRISGLQTFDEFTRRRLTPAVKTCRATAARQQSLSDRVARATQLLSTRVDLERQRQNQTLLSSMNQRAKMQLRLQATVEGLSVAAITYYVVGLVYYLAQGLEQFGLPIRPAVWTAFSVPVVALLIFAGVRRVRRRLSEDDAK